MAIDDLFDMLKVKISLDVDEESVNKTEREMKSRMQWIFESIQQQMRRNAQRDSAKIGEEYAEKFESGFVNRIKRMRDKINIFGSIKDSELESYARRYLRHVEQVQSRMEGKQTRHIRTYQMAGGGREQKPIEKGIREGGEGELADYRKMKFNVRMVNNLTDFIDDFFFGIAEAFYPVISGLPEPMQQKSIGMLAMAHTQTKQLGVVSAKIGIVGVVLNKIYEVIMKVAKFSGLALASLQLLSTFVGLVLKPIADLIGVILVPMLIVFIKAWMPVLRKWNDIVGVWLRESSGKDKLAQTLMAMTGFLTGGLWGGLAGALTPMLYKYSKTTTDPIMKLLTSIGALVGLVKFASSLFGTLGVHMGGFAQVISPIIGLLKIFGSAIGKVAIVGFNLGKAFMSLVGTIVGGGGLISAIVTLGTVIGGIYAMYKLIKGFFKGEYDIMKEGAIEREWKFDPFGVRNKVGDDINAIEQTTYEILEEMKYSTDNLAISVGDFDTSMEETRQLMEELNNITVTEGYNILGGQDTWYSSILTIFDFANETIPEPDEFANNTSGSLFDTILQILSIATGTAIIKKQSLLDAIDEYFEALKPPKPSTTSGTTTSSISGGTSIGWYQPVSLGSEPSSTSIIPEIQLTVDMDNNSGGSGGGGGQQAKEFIKMYQIGGYIPETGVYMLHKGEMVLPIWRIGELEEAYHRLYRMFEMIKEPPRILQIERPRLIDTGGIIKRKEAPQPVENKIDRIDVNVSVDKVGSEIDIDDMARELASKIMREIELRGGV